MRQTPPPKQNLPSSRSHSRRREGFRGNGTLARVFLRLLFLGLLGGFAFAVYHYIKSDFYNASMREAEGIYDQGEYASALEAYKKISERYPEKIEPLLAAAHAAEKANDTEAAVSAYRRGAEILPDDDAPSRALIFCEIGRLYAARQAWDEARKNFEEAVYIDSTNHDAHMNLGEALERLGDMGAALEAYQRAFALRPSSDAAMNAIKRLSSLPPGGPMGDPLAAQQYEHAMQVGTVALDLKLYEEATKYFAEALAIRSDDADAWVKFGETRAHLGDTNGAITSMRRALERDSSREDARSQLAALEEERRKRNASP